MSLLGELEELLLADRISWLPSRSVRELLLPLPVFVDSLGLGDRRCR